LDFKQKSDSEAKTLKALGVGIYSAERGVEFELESEISYSAYLCWIGLGSDWIWTIVQFVEFGLDPDYKSLQNLGSGPHLD